VPQSYEFLPVYQPIADDDFETTPDNTALFIAKPDEMGEYASRTLRLTLDQISYLHQYCDLTSILFRNGDAEVYLRCEEMYTGPVAKLAAYMLEADPAEPIDLAAMDFETMLDVELIEEQLESVKLEVRIDPVLLPDERTAWEVHVSLVCEEREVEIPKLLAGMVICMNINGMFDAETKATFTQNYAMALVNTDALTVEEITERRLPGIMLCFPSAAGLGAEDVTEHFALEYIPGTAEVPAECTVDYTYEVEIQPYRNDILATVNAGEGGYLLIELNPEPQADTI